MFLLTFCWYHFWSFYSCAYIHTVTIQFRHPPYTYLSSRCSLCYSTLLLSSLLFSTPLFLIRLSFTPSISTFIFVPFHHSLLYQFLLSPHLLITFFILLFHFLPQFPPIISRTSFYHYVLYYFLSSIYSFSFFIFHLLLQDSNKQHEEFQVHCFLQRYCLSRQPPERKEATRHGHGSGHSLHCGGH